MTDRQTFCSALGLEPAAAAPVLDAAAADGGPRGAAGWLAEAVLALAGWITALVLVLLAAAFLHQVFGIDDPSWVHPALGAGLFATAMALLHRRDGAYGTQVAVALAAAGAALFAGGVAAVYHESLAGARAAGATGPWRWRPSPPCCRRRRWSRGAGAARCCNC
ncbi:MAG: hypothetical protein H6906_06825 [Hyphomicrobiales bacterium]|nr:hypothetical protein [Hyphomicrobiales bacterium]